MDAMAKVLWVEERRALTSCWEPGFAKAHVVPRPGLPVASWDARSPMQKSGPARPGARLARLGVGGAHVLRRCGLRTLHACDLEASCCWSAACNRARACRPKARLAARWLTVAGPSSTA